MEPTFAAHARQGNSLGVHNGALPQPTFVAPDARLAALREVHAAMPAKPHLDGVYLSPEDGWPADNRVTPFVVDGEFHTDRPCGELNPVLWLTLQRHGIPVRGPRLRGTC
jgi:hypothetical protein